ncbi:MAG: hypothetical protein WC069_04430 [Candidatus Shapirobacteria bacterium]
MFWKKFNNMDDEWSVCLVASLPKNFEPETEKIDRRINLFDPKILETVMKCRKRWEMDGVYLNGKCEGCVAKCRLNLDSLGN